MVFYTSQPSSRDFFDSVEDCFVRTEDNIWSYAPRRFIPSTKAPPLPQKAGFLRCQLNNLRADFDYVRHGPPIDRLSRFIDFPKYAVISRSLTHQGFNQSRTSLHVFNLVCPEGGEPLYHLPSALLEDDEVTVSQTRSSRRRTRCGKDCVTFRGIVIRTACPPVERTKFVYSVPTPSVSVMGSACPFCRLPSCVSSSSPGRSAPNVPLRARRHLVHFMTHIAAGVSLKALRTPNKDVDLMYPDEAVLTEFGVLGRPDAIHLVLNQRGLQKRITRIPVKCCCGTITRAGLALEIAETVESYFRTETCRPGYHDEESQIRDKFNSMHLTTLRTKDRGATWRAVCVEYAGP